MIHKRPFVDKDSYEVASKQPRLLEHACQLSPAIDIVPSNRQIGNMQFISSYLEILSRGKWY